MENSNVKVFENYVSMFDKTIDAIDRKHNHSLRVATIAFNIAKSLKLRKDDLTLAYNIGLLHDIARFRQWTEYETFNDKLSIDHADLAISILFDDNLLSDYKINKSDYEYLKYAIKYHNKLDIDSAFIENFCKENDLNIEKMMTHCRIVRDADKLDIFNIIISNRNICKISELELGGYTEEIMKSFKKRESCNHKYLHTVLDRALSDLCLAFDLNYKFSKKEFGKLAKDYSLSTLNHYSPYLNKDDSDILKACIEEYNNYFKKL